MKRFLSIPWLIKGWKPLVLCYAVFYLYGLVDAWTKPLKVIEGTISYIDFEERQIGIKGARHEAFACAFSPDLSSRVLSFEQGASVIAHIGYVPDFLFPNCRTFKLVSLTSR